ncbi:MAG: hypothetical protein ACLGIK_06980, partial [Gemmatimonadota bacterium]
FAILEGKKVNENLTAWPATALSFDVFDATRGAQMVSRLAGNEIMTDWGARPLSARSALFDPLHYNNGAVWPFVTGWVSLAQYRYHNAHAGRFALEAIARTGFDEALGRNPEVISGRVYKPLDTAVPHQFFATSMVLTPLVRGLLGIEIDAPAGRVTVAPHLPADWDGVRVEQLAVGDARLALRLERTGRTLALSVSRQGGASGRPITVEFAPALPVGAQGVARAGDGTRLEARALPGAVIARDSAVLREAVQLAVQWEGGWEISPPRHAARIGERSSALRVLSERMQGTSYRVALEGRAGMSYALRVRAPRGAPASASVGIPNAAAVPMRLGEPDHAGWVTVVVDVPSQGADADGFVALELAFTGN